MALVMADAVRPRSLLNKAGPLIALARSTRVAVSCKKGASDWAFHNGRKLWSWKRDV